MRVELALFHGDDLLERGQIDVSVPAGVSSFRLFRASHRLAAGVADIVLDGFAEGIALKRVSLDMPVHESEDWESIELDKYTLAFWCRLNVH